MSWLRSDDIFAHTVEPVGECVVELNGGVVATSGYFLHYNRPFADVFMEVHPDHRRGGLGSFLVQEIIAACHADGRVPAARCSVDNNASRLTLTKAGMRICGYMLTGDIMSASIRA